QSLAAVSLAFLLFLEISALVLNLLPVPPLDGFQAIAPWLGQGFYERGMAFSNFGFFLLFLLLWYSPPVRDTFWNAVTGISSFLGVDQFLVDVGSTTYRFWRSQG